MFIQRAFEQRLREIMHKNGVKNAKNLLLAGNWKMNMTNSEACGFMQGMHAVPHGSVKLVMCVPATALGVVSELAKKKNIALGLQNMHWEEQGAYTGEVSASMLLDAGGEYVIIGHSERRMMLGETDLTVNLKVRTAQAHRITPIVCIGESVEERENDTYKMKLCHQIVAGLIGTKSAPLVIAYEPIWAIGTGKVASVEQVSETMNWIRRAIVEQYGEAGYTIPLLYGGSAKPDNVKALSEIPDVDGFLVGGASLSVESIEQMQTALSV